MTQNDALGQASDSRVDIWLGFGKQSLAIMEVTRALKCTDVQMEEALLKGVLKRYCSISDQRL